MSGQTEGMRLTWVGHATVVLDLGGARILTDPLLRPHAGPLHRIGPRPDPASWEGTDAVLVSHLHHDHAELRSIALLPPGLPYVAGRENAAWLEQRAGLTTLTGDLGEWLDVAGLEVALLHADHHSRPMPHRPNEANGHLLRHADGVVWFAGDTDLYPGLADLPDLAGAPVDVALVPIAGWGPRLSPGHMGPTEAARACAMTGARAALPIHHATFHVRGMQYAGLHWMHRPLEAFAKELTRLAPGCELLTVPLGGSVEV